MTISSLHAIFHASVAVCRLFFFKKSKNISRTLSEWFRSGHTFCPDLGLNCSRRQESPIARKGLKLSEAKSVVSGLKNCRIIIFCAGEFCIWTEEKRVVRFLLSGKSKGALAIRRIFSLVDMNTKPKFSNCPDVFKIQLFR